jgi:hypothetical protein
MRTSRLLFCSFRQYETAIGGYAQTVLRAAVLKYGFASAAKKIRD